MAFSSIILTCEHAGNQVPVRYRSLFTNEHILNTDRGWDAGALDLSVALSEELNFPCFVHQTTRLLVDVNHSLNNPYLFSEFSFQLGDEDKQLLLDKYYFPYRLRVENTIALTQKPVLHFSIHTFSPVWEEVVRLTDIGILFDPQRELEKSIAEKLLTHLQKELPNLRIELNEPFKGTDDSFTAYLRTRFAEEEYVGLVLEVNQKSATGADSEKIALTLNEFLRLLRN